MLHHILAHTRSRLQAHSQSASMDSQVLLAHILGRPRSWILAHPETTLTPSQVEKLESAIRRLESGEPLPYLLGHWEFYGLDFQLNSATLIPRPETELLVEQALLWLKRRCGKTLAVDVGTGSGCIAISLAKNASQVEIVACDISLAALQVAQINAQNHQVSSQVHLVNCDLTTALNTTFDLVCANLPYIPQARLDSLEVARVEPVLALNGGLNGLSQIARLMQEAKRLLAAHSLLLLEIDHTQTEAVINLAHQHLLDIQVSVIRDFAGLDRLVRIERNIPSRQ